ncbi:MAG TPA: DUF192 domain-containing protein [Verrucomicrobiae bacterium]|jgi:hypothetical protein|nr:DUF192 domain-containing protein [Verrucomicrobiae bacterium]
MKRLAFLYLLVIMGAMGGCKPSSTATSPPSAPPSAYPTAPQPKLQTIKLWIGQQEMITEMALTPVQQETGMMFRTNMAENEGMIFPFSQPIRADFWMKNTILPLSCAYIGPDGTILEIHDMKPQDTNSIVAETSNIQYVLETRQGWFKRNNVGVGTVITTEHGPLHQVFR